MDEDAELEKTVRGLEQASVEFVRDYIQLHFDGPTLSIMSDPVLHRDGKGIASSKKDFKDALCACIGQTVSSVMMRDAVEMTVLFANGASLAIPLLREGGRESATLFGDGKYIRVW